jgi:hypothetical protein
MVELLDDARTNLRDLDVRSITLEARRRQPGLSGIFLGQGALWA